MINTETKTHLISHDVGGSLRHLHRILISPPAASVSTQPMSKSERVKNTTWSLEATFWNRVSTHRGVTFDLFVCWSSFLGKTPAAVQGYADWVYLWYSLASGWKCEHTAASLYMDDMLLHNQEMDNPALVSAETDHRYHVENDWRILDTGGSKLCSSTTDMV